MKTIFLLIIILFSQISNALTIEGIDIKETQNLNKEVLTLNGVGTRKATWFKVKVYLGSLYLKKKTKVIKEILSTDYPKILNMNFVYNVGKDKLIAGWNEGFVAAHGKSDYPELTKFNSLMNDIKKGQIISIQFLSKGVNVSFNNGPFTFIKSNSFSRKLLSIWFVNPRDPELAKGMQGLL
jgi:hypothetical protein